MSGCIILPGHLNEEQQLDFLEQALAEYTRPPNPLSLSTHYPVPSNLFELYAGGDVRAIPPLNVSHTVVGDENVASSATKTRQPRRTIDTEPASVIGYEEVIARNKTFTGDTPSDKLEARTAGELMRSLRWANLGWVYQVGLAVCGISGSRQQWSTKSYDFSTSEPIPFPPKLARVCSDVVSDVSWEGIFSEGALANLGCSAWKTDYGMRTSFFAGCVLIPQSLILVSSTSTSSKIP